MVEEIYTSPAQNRFRQIHWKLNPIINPVAEVKPWTIFSEALTCIPTTSGNNSSVEESRQSWFFCRKMFYLYGRTPLPDASCNRGAPTSTFYRVLSLLDQLHTSPRNWLPRKYYSMVQPDEEFYGPGTDRIILCNTNGTPPIQKCVCDLSLFCCVGKTYTW